MSARDTTPDALAVRTAIYRQIGPARRCELAASMSATARALTRDGIRHRHPEYDEQQLQWALFRVLVGSEMFRRVWPRAPIVAP